MFHSIILYIDESFITEWIPHLKSEIRPIDRRPNSGAFVFSRVTTERQACCYRHVINCPRFLLRTARHRQMDCSIRYTAYSSPHDSKCGAPRPKGHELFKTAINSGLIQKHNFTSQSIETLVTKIQSPDGRCCCLSPKARCSYVARGCVQLGSCCCSGTVGGVSLV